MHNIISLAGDYGITLTGEMVRGFDVYEELLLSWNERINLTAITQHDEIVVKHFLDSLLLLKAYPIPLNAAVIDIGTGAGFPGVPLKIARPDINLTLLDSLNKRLNFLSELSEALGQSNALIHGRAEQFARTPHLRERFAVATARGLAALPALCEYCLPYVAVGGIFAALKGPDARREAEDSAKAIAELGAELENIVRFDLPGEQKRAIILIRKSSQTPSKYPRNAVKITKTPLM